jgi:sugar phosphate isomerase/epimerase
MRIGFCNEYDPERIEFSRRHGFTCTSLITSHLDPQPDYLPGHEGWEERAEALKAEYDDAGVRISSLGAFYRNCLDPADEANSRQIVRNAILFAEHLGIPVVAGFPGRVMDEPLEASLPRYREVWSELARFAEDHGVKVAFENCPMGRHFSPVGGNNCMATPEMFEKCFNEVDSPALGLEWDPSHLVCSFVDPVANIRRFGERIHAVHAKGAKVHWDLVRRYGLWHRGAVEHCFPGLGDEDWGQIVRELRRAGYAGDLVIEGIHDPVYLDHSQWNSPLAGKVPDLEDTGLLIALNHLRQWVPLED